MLQKIKEIFVKKDKKNIIFIALDGVRLDLFRNYPSFKSISSQGTLFSKVVTYSPHSIASFHAIFTGLYGSKSGVNSYFGTLNFKKNQSKTIPQYLQEAGYYCLGDSMNELVVPKQGFDKLVVQKEFTEFIDQHKDFIAEVARKNQEKTPCFLHLHCSYLHNRLVHEVIKKFKDKESEYAGKEEMNTQRYQSFLAEIDLYTSTIIEELKKHHLLDNSLVVFFSDHGSSLGEKKGELAYGNFCYDYSLLTFALFIDLKLFVPNKEVTNLVRNVDLLPTILNYLNLKPDKSKLLLDGESLLSFTHGNSALPRFAFSETGGMSGPFPSPKEPNIHALRTDEWKLIYIRPTKQYQLFYLRDDPREEHDLSGKGLAIEALLQARLQEHLSFSDQERKE